MFLFPHNIAFTYSYSQKGTNSSIGFFYYEYNQCEGIIYVIVLICGPHNLIMQYISGSEVTSI